ncbi:ATP-binding cassette domain-containing protein [uncultured Sutterella sp.]|uniref:ATP-binding cassette domain-containing protein n=1 Tax=uncultured Sutterella sp. TaxID=286133 RepID=UPI0025EB57CB|nr:ATP-binding cassette domain-containing protein [uncultured Sutterella sp.]
MLKKLSALILPLLLLLLWWGVTAAGAVPPLLLPGPEAVARRFMTLLASGELLRHAAVSMARVFSGFLLSAATALLLALLFCRHPKVEGAFSLTLEALRVVPPLSLVPLLILWLGIDEAPKLAIVVLASFFPVHLSALSAMRSVRSGYLDLSRVLGLSGAQTVRHILLPGAAPGIITGLRLGFGYAWRALVGAELIAAASGLGYLIEDASSLARTDVVIVGILTIAGLGILCDALFRRAARVLTPWTAPEGSRRRKPAASASCAPQCAEEPARTEPQADLRKTLPGIELDHLTVGYPGGGRPPVEDLTLTIAPGRITALLGRSGCGKTTLMKAVAGLLPVRDGAVRFTGEVRPKTAMVFQEPTLLPWKTVRGNVAAALFAQLGDRAALTDPRVDEALRLVGLEGRASSLPGELSGGQQQRVGFARALAAGPDVLLMDEPFGALDALTRRELQDESTAVFARRRMTVLMITHDVREAVRMADAAVILREGAAPEVFPVDLPHPRRLSDPGVAALEEGILDVLMRR